MYSFTKYRFFRLFHALRKAIFLCLLPFLLCCSCTVWLDSLSIPHFLGNACECERACVCVWRARVCISELHISILKWFHTSNKRPWLIYRHIHSKSVTTRNDFPNLNDVRRLIARACKHVVFHFSRPLFGVLATKETDLFWGRKVRFMRFELKLTMPMICVVQRIPRKKTWQTK